MESTSRPAIVFLLTSSRARLDLYRSIHHAYHDTLTLIMINPTLEPDFSPFFHHWLLSDSENPSHLASLLRGFAMQAVISFDEYGVHPAAKLAEMLKVRPYPMGSDVLRKIMDKRKFRGWCESHGIPSPGYLHVG
jgi:hypothetical protein